MPVEEHKHMWDGSEPGWTLRQLDHTVWRISFSFLGDGPTQSEILNLRKLLPEIRSTPVSALFTELRGRSTYRLLNDFGNIEMRTLMDSANELGLHASAEPVDRGGYTPVHPDGSDIIIEDNDISVCVTEKMLAAGVPVTRITHVD